MLGLYSAHVTRIFWGQLKGRSWQSSVYYRCLCEIPLRHREHTSSRADSSHVKSFLAVAREPAPAVVMWKRVLVAISTRRRAISIVAVRGYTDFEIDVCPRRIGFPIDVPK